MATCDLCGRDENMPYNCRYCGGTFCAEHRLPENHDCPGLQDWNDPGAVFDSGFDDSVRNSGQDSQDLFDRVGFDLGAGGPLGYFRGNMSYVFLGLMWVTFATQWIVLLLFGGEAHRAIFALSSSNPEYIWTWFTSIFAHSPFNFFHIVFNSIVLYFFGPLVERYVGTNRFAALFIVAGVVAGLGQVGTALAVGDTSAVLGASGAIMAIMGVLTVLNPNLKVYLYFILPMPLWLLTLGFAIISVFFISVGGIGAGGVAQLAHLAGLVIGLGYGEKLKREGRQVPTQLRLGPGGGGPGGPRRRF